MEVPRGIKQYYEQHHHVVVNDEIIKLAVIWSERYISDRFLPDKAIDLLDEACACASLASKELTENAKLNQQLKQLSDEEAHLSEATDNPNFERIAEVKAEILRIREELKELEPKASHVEVTVSDLAKVIELSTGIPANKVAQDDYQKILHLEEELNHRIIGQPEAVSQGSTCHQTQPFTAIDQKAPRFLYFCRSNRRRQNRACKGFVCRFV